MMDYIDIEKYKSDNDLLTFDKVVYDLVGESIVHGRISGKVIGYSTKLNNLIVCLDQPILPYDNEDLADKHIGEGWFKLSTCDVINVDVDFDTLFGLHYVNWLELLYGEEAKLSFKYSVKFK